MWKGMKSHKNQFYHKEQSIFCFLNQPDFWEHIPQTGISVTPHYNQESPSSQDPLSLTLATLLVWL